MKYQSKNYLYNYNIKLIEEKNQLEKKNNNNNFQTCFLFYLF